MDRATRGRTPPLSSSSASQTRSANTMSPRGGGSCLAEASALLCAAASTRECSCRKLTCQSLEQARASDAHLAARGAGPALERERAHVSRFDTSPPAKWTGCGLRGGAAFVRYVRSTFPYSRTAFWSSYVVIDRETGRLAHSPLLAPSRLRVSCSARYRLQASRHNNVDERAQHAAAPTPELLLFSGSPRQRQQTRRAGVWRPRASCVPPRA